MKNQVWRILQSAVFILLCLFIKVSGLSTKRRVERPMFLPTKTNITVHIGDMAVLECKIRNLGPKEVSWRKVSRDYPLTVGVFPFDPYEDIAVDFKKRKRVAQYNLIIKQVTLNHTGKYECQISAIEIYTHHVYLHVLETPKIVKPAIEISGSTFVNLFDEIKLTCNATGSFRAPIDIDWFHDGQKITPDQRKKIIQYRPTVPGRYLVSDLVIEYSLLEDRGRYVCRSSDLATIFQDVSVLNSGKDADPVVRDVISKTEKEHDKRRVKNTTKSAETGSRGDILSSNIATTTVLVTFVTLWTLLVR